MVPGKSIHATMLLVNASLCSPTPKAYLEIKSTPSHRCEPARATAESYTSAVLPRAATYVTTPHWQSHISPTHVNTRQGQRRSGKAVPSTVLAGSAKGASSPSKALAWLTWLRRQDRHIRCVTGCLTHSTTSHNLEGYKHNSQQLHAALIQQLATGTRCIMPVAMRCAAMKSLPARHRYSMRRQTSLPRICVALPSSAHRRPATQRCTTRLA
jgi:hypothetical protein